MRDISFDWLQLFNQVSNRQLSLSKGQYTAWPEPIWIKVSEWWQIPPQHQITSLGGPESASIEIPPFRPHFINLSKTAFYEVNFVSQFSHLEVLLLSKFGSERGILIVENSGPLGHALWCCGSKSQDFFTFIQIVSGHTVNTKMIKGPGMGFHRCWLKL